MKTCVGYESEHGHVECGGPLMSIACQSLMPKKVLRCPRCSIKQKNFKSAQYRQMLRARKVRVVHGS